jgi:hypothetical protein
MPQTSYVSQKPQPCTVQARSRALVYYISADDTWGPEYLVKPTFMQVATHVESREFRDRSELTILSYALEPSIPSNFCGEGERRGMHGPQTTSILTPNHVILPTLGVSNIGTQTGPLHLFFSSAASRAKPLNL